MSINKYFCIFSAPFEETDALIQVILCPSVCILSNARNNCSEGPKKGLDELKIDLVDTKTFLMNEKLLWWTQNCSEGPKIAFVEIKTATKYPKNALMN